MATPNSAKDIASNIKQGKAVITPVSMATLADVDRELSAQVAINRVKPLVIIYTIEAKSAVVTYPLISKVRLNISSEVPLEPKDFMLILHQPEIVGNILPSSLAQRLKEDWRTITPAVLILLVALTLLVTLSQSSAVQYKDYLADADAYPFVQNIINFYGLMGQSLLTVMTLFLTVFVLFTIYQNSDLGKDINLYNRGLFHKFIRDDQYITTSSAISLITSSLGLLFTAVPSEIYNFTIQGLQFNKINSLIPLLYSISAATFFISLTSLSYYSNRVITANESNLLKEILDKREEAIKEQRKVLDAQEANNGAKKPPVTVP